MAKKASLVDKALEVSRKVRVPKKPVKTKGKKTVPAVLDWGTGIPEDKLAYLNDDEMALVQANRMFKGKRSHKGVPAFPDPKDTGAGGNSHLPDSGGGAGTGGRPGGAGGQPGSSSPSSSSSSSPGAGGQSGASQTKDQSKPAAPSGGPSAGPTSAPARTEPSRAATPPSSFGPRSGSMPGTPVSTAPSTAAYEGALSRIAQGSSVVGNPSGQKQFTDRVPQAQSPTVNFSQSPMAGPNRGLGGISQPKEDLTLGANSPFASPGLAGYNRETYNPSIASSAPAGLLGPSVPVGTAGYTKEQQAARFPGAGAYNTAATMPGAVNAANASAPVASAMPSPAFAATDPRVAQTPAGAYPAATPMDPSFPGRIADAKTLGEQLAFASGAAANKIGSYIGSAAQNVGDYASSLFGGEPEVVAGVDPRASQTPVGSYPQGYASTYDKIRAENYNQLNPVEKAVYNTVDYGLSAAQRAGNYVGSLFGGEPSTQTAATKTPAQEAAELQNLIAQQNAYPSLTPDKALTDAYTEMELAALREGSPRAAKMQDRISASYNPADVSINPQTGLPQGEKIQDRLPGYGTPAPLSPAEEALALQQTISANKAKAAQQAAIPAASPSELGRVVSLSEYGTPPLTQETLNQIVGNPLATWGEFQRFQEGAPKVAAAEEFLSAGRNLPSEYTSGFVTADQVNLPSYGDPVGKTRGIDGSFAQAENPVTTNPFNKSPAEQAMDVRRAVALAQGPARTPTEINIPGRDAPTPASVATETPQYAYNDVPFSQGDYLPSQAPAYDVSPSQQSGWSAEQRDAYLNSIMGGRSGGGILANVNGPMMAAPAGASGAKSDKKYLPPMPPWQDYDYLYTDYPEIAYAPDQRIIDFNNYNATFKKGGRVGDSVDAALRLARHSIVSRPKTR